MLRRHFLGAAAAATLAPLAMPRLVRAGEKSVLRFIPFVDLSLLGPVATTATPTRNHAFMVFDTLYGLDAQFEPQPQMVQGHTIEDDGRRWELTLREGLRFHDGSAVTGRDCVASIRRWAARDSFGQALMAVTDELSAPDDRTILFRLSRPFPLLPAALAKASPSICAIMPERLAKTDSARQVTEMVGSGPFRFLPDEHMAGVRAAYARFDGYVPRPDGVVGGTAGPKVAHFERVEWTVMPDVSAASGALMAGEADWWETPSPDLVALLKHNKDLRVEVKDRQGLTPILRFNCIQPPFDNVALRRAVLGAVDQSEFMQAYSSDPETWHVKLGMFCPGTPMANDVGFDRLFGKTDIARARQEVAASGYKGEKVAFMLPMDHPVSAPIGQVGIDLFQRIGLNVDVQAMDSGTLFQRRSSREPVEKGGWSVFPSMVSGLNILNPAVTSVARANGLKGWYGWPTSAEAERLRDAWMEERDPAAQKKLAEQMQAQAWEDATFLPTGQIFQPMAWRHDSDGVLDGFVKFWNVRRA
ncbi:ABC transporter substrate-binding protein [Roseomonas sp. E05]|uniref:ABC transporter substrate-binding protein n=1 Tax=Roseomonas sp. E05 TaxID=3046310 RepID=UPI0024BB532F|nr:ABC transporter substrate-binding protein [Roseomonas sp. E05]MDJ0388564.1 ABC transporter substrate-binding protein [Roseomonas sp. E05]